MKGLFLLVILGVFHYTSATGGKCSCAVFLKDGSSSRPVADTRILSTDDTDLDDCGDAGRAACERSCYDTVSAFSLTHELLIDKLTDGGKLEHTNKDGKTVADIACGRLARELSRGEIGSFVKVCGGEWTFHHGTTPKHLCCQNNHSVAC
ncbi:hypothetical protein J437_LFUL003114 [Ladona fulva]|uniref:Uncharacterized protein n=1 Tax=Ladona fulva TaxID=123851 RepID=A0A8K0JWM2_LADFU|nr:hypothetical protein J437_LFUL003114 [Ladona fulva]